ncbi:helix-turn-helix domain-containing protein [Desmonostoc muscorum LEGE 12446]|uniref:Helix-turn-helix domain-containing protein n=1 Tax=Desmonostoc muscorum LEGE 12446 TaxID=1828758 RepID=A0A8J6ZHT1_DESMC|nr:helix-turn-helix domain-containing protein [Desmonostoc muscorum]MCF2152337.1 helix-turn-helix domain-containing protein [Desmonostoc muscorum LEGE 12446]
MSEQSNSKLLSVSEVAKELEITRQRVHDLIKNGQIIAHKLGRFYYIEEAEMQRYRDKPVGKPYQPRTTASTQNSIDNCQ